MKFNFSRLLVTFTAWTGVLVSTVSAANPAYSNGDLLLGVRATADPGSTENYVINLGPASQFTQAVEAITVSGLSNITTDLARFSETGVVEWNTRSDVFWSIVGTDLAADPANTLYVTRPRVDVGTQTAAWTRQSYSTQSATNSIFRAFISGFSLSQTNAANSKATFQQVSSTNSYASFTAGGTDFGAYSGIEGNFGAGAAGSVLDLYRLTPTTQNAAGAGLVFVGTFQFSNSGTLTFNPPAPTAPFFRLTSATYSVNEDAGTATVTVTRGGLLTGTDTVQFDTANDTAIADTDYKAKNGFTVTFEPNETQATVTVEVTLIPGLQTNRAFNVALSSPSAGTINGTSSASVTIVDSTPQNFGTIAFASATISGAPVNNVGDPNVIPVQISRTSGTDGQVSVSLAVAAGGSLVSGTDFTALPTTVTFNAGEATKTVNIQLAALADAKLPGTINLTLSNAQGGASIGATASTTVTVSARDKQLPTLALTTKSGKVSASALQLAGSAKDNAGVDRVEVRVNGGAIQFANLQAPVNGSRNFDLSGITLENGKNSIVVTAFDASGNPGKSKTLKIAYANLRPQLAGSFNGLASPDGAASNDKTGFVTLKVTPLGLFTGKVTIGAAALPIKGIFDNAGVAHFNASGDTTAAPTDLDLSKKISGVLVEYGTLSFSIAPEQVTGNLRDGAVVLANIDANRAFFDGKTPATTVAANYLVNGGKYTVVFPSRSTQATLTSSEYPQGDGIATLKITPKGVATLKGTLADGTAISASAPVSEDYHWPFFAKAYKKGGVIAVDAQFNDALPATDILGANAIWIRPASAVAKHYPAGWPASILTDLFGAKHANIADTSILPGVGAPELVNGNADLQFSDGKLSGPVSKTVSVSAQNKVTNAPADKSFTLSITAATGLFGGKFTHSDNTKPAFKGAIYGKGPDAGGYGFFLSTVPKGGPSGESGVVTLNAK